MNCLNTDCKGQIKGQRYTGKFYEGDDRDCPKCGARYRIALTDDYEEDCVPYLIPLDEEHGQECDFTLVIAGQMHRSPGAFARCTCGATP